MSNKVFTNSYLCRTTMSTKLYSRPNDINPSKIILPSSIIFETDQEVNIGTVKLLRISSIVSNIDNVDIFINKWVTTNSLECNPLEALNNVENSKFDDSDVCDETLLVTGEDIILYDTNDALTPLICHLKMGDLIKVDRKINVVINGLTQERYRIASVQSADSELNDDYLGCWIVYNYALQMKSVMDNIKPVKAATKKAAVTATQSGTAAIDESGATTINTASGISGSRLGRILGSKSTIDELFSDFSENYYTSAIMGQPVSRMLFVHGMPFQYHYLTDRRNGSRSLYGRSEYDYQGNVSIVKFQNDYKSDFYGRTFAKEIASNMPIVTVVPGKPNFMTTVNTGVLLGKNSTKRKAKSGFSTLFQALDDVEVEGALSELNLGANSDQVYQYYSIKIDTKEYYNYVNSLCKTSAVMLGIGDVDFMDGNTCGQYNWEDYNTSASQDYSMVDSIVGSDGGVSFAFDPLSSITDSLGNSTTESQFAGLFSGLSSKAREAEFLLGAMNSDIPNLVNSTDFEEATAEFKTGAFSSARNVLSNVSTFAKNAGHGMNIRFPQLWSDSSSSKSYSIQMKFVTPYATNFCKWRYVLVPFFSWFALAAPHSDDSVSNYSRPFLIKAFSKGYFNIEMGIINSIQWTKFGDGDMISADGIPTEIDVTVDFEDLYQQLAVSGYHNIDTREFGVFFNNTGLMDLVGTMSGINMNRVGIKERFELYSSALENSITNINENWTRRISDRFNQMANNFFYSL